MRRPSFDQWVLLLAVVAGAVSTSVIGLTTLHNSREGARAHAALCIFKDDLARRVQQSRDFLAQHPHGVAGISAATIQIGINNQHRTIKSLASLHCPATKG